MRFYLGTHRPNWLGKTDVPLFVSRRVLAGRKSFPEALGGWALDSGGFTELNLYGAWRTSEADYIRDVRLFEREVDGLEWVAPMDWMCEPFVLSKTGLSVGEHQARTVWNFIRLRDELGLLVVPVLQGWTPNDYLECAYMYERAGVDLGAEPLVGVGSVCRRQNTHEAARIFRSLEGLRLHAFGVKLDGLSVYGDCLRSADSMAWSYRARHDRPLPGCTHKSCANCLRYALRWRARIMEGLGQQRLEVAV